MSGYSVFLLLDALGEDASHNFLVLQVTAGCWRFSGYLTQALFRRERSRQQYFLLHCLLSVPCEIWPPNHCLLHNGSGASLFCIQPDDVLLVVFERTRRGRSISPNSHFHCLKHLANRSHTACTCSGWTTESIEGTCSYFKQLRFGRLVEGCPCHHK